jgi:hypothetical protein
LTSPAPDALVRPRWWLWLLIAAGAIGFIVIATMNSSGYRYAAADQAFYIPAIRQHLDPTLFPHDSAVLAAHGRFTPYDEIMAAIVRVTGVSLPALFFVAYVFTLALFYGALILLGQQLYRSPWTTAVLVAFYTLRHRIARTGANTLEGYFHPRVLVFAIGVLALHAVLQRRPARAWVLLAIGAVLHPTTALFFAVWVGVALAVNEPRLRRPLLIVTAAAGALGVALLAIGTVSLKAMDADWLASLTDKDYILPMDWPLEAWVFNLMYPAIIALCVRYRRRFNLMRPGEMGLVVGAYSLVALFFASFPLLLLHSAIVVQLQLSRLFWLVELLASVYCAWIAVEMWRIPKEDEPEALRPPSPQVVSAWRGRLVFLLLLIMVSGRGWFNLRHDHEDRRLFEIELPDDYWTDVGRWLRDHTPHDADLLADPGHAWRFGASLRVTAERDVFIEDIKDVAIGMYDRKVAMRNMERRAALGDFFSLSPAQFQELAARYDLQYLVTDRVEPFDEVYHNRVFHVYRLK